MLINIVFEGGGIKGIAYVGVLRFLEERGIRIFQAGGTSVGALFASLIAAGYTSYEIENIIDNFNVDILTPEIKEKPINRIIKTVKSKGIYNINQLESYLENILKQKGKVRFRDLKFGDRYLLKVITTEIKTKRMLILPDDLRDLRYDPDQFPIAKAVVMSSTIPIFYTPYAIGQYRFLDGGVTNNFPINLFSDSHLPTLGFRLNTSKDPKIIRKYQKKIFKVDNELNLEQFNVIDINTFGIKATDFHKGLAFKQNLINSGYNSMRKFFYENIS